MRILHTSDWHLGKTLERIDRRAEQEAFVAEICEICAKEKVQMVLIAGDVYQNANPSAAAEQLFYYAADRLAAGGTRAVVAIAGNHDSPDRLCAASPLAEQQGITLIGYPGDPVMPSLSAGPEKVRRIAAGASWAEIVVPGCDHAAVIAALPYPSEGRLRELVSESLEDTDMLRAYNLKIAAIFRQLAAHYRPDTVNLAMTHLYVQGGIETGTENQIQTIGGSYAIDPAVFPERAQYVALGHLHRPQNTAGSPVPARYAGAPLAYSFAEDNHPKSVTLVAVEPGKAAVIKEIPLTAGKPLVSWKAAGFDEVVRGLENGIYASAWIDLEIMVAGTADVDQMIRQIRGMSDNIIKIRITGPGIEEEGEDSRRASLESLPLSELFTLFYKRQTGGLEPGEAIVRLFMELAGDQAAEEARAEEAVS